MAEYVTRMDSMTQATDTYAAHETGVDGGTPGAIPVAAGRSKIAQILALMVLDGAQAADTGNVITLEVGKNALDAPHEIVLAGYEEAEVGTAAHAGFQLQQPFLLGVDLTVKASSTLSLRSAYGGTDPGSPEFYTTLVLA